MNSKKLLERKAKLRSVLDAADVAYNDRDIAAFCDIEFYKAEGHDFVMYDVARNHVYENIGLALAKEPPCPVKNV